MNKAQELLKTFDEIKFVSPSGSVAGKGITLKKGDKVTHSGGNTGIVVKQSAVGNYKIKWDKCKYPRKMPDGFPPDIVHGSVLRER